MINSPSWRTPFLLTALAIIAFPLNSACCGPGAPSAKHLQELLEKFPVADTNGDGTLPREEAIAYRDKFSARGASGEATWRVRTPGIKREFKVNPGWDLERFPEHAVCYKSPAEIKTIYLSDAWPQLEQLEKNPESETFFTAAILDRMGNEKRAS